MSINSRFQATSQGDVAYYPMPPCMFVLPRFAICVELVTVCLKIIIWAGENAQQLGAFAALVEDPG